MLVTYSIYSEGCHLFKGYVRFSMENDRLAEAKTVCDMSDVVIACFGLDPGLEGEEGDRVICHGDKPNLNLPEFKKKY